MAPIKRILRLAAALLALLTYVWVAAVRATPLIKRRKARKRALTGS
jgi:hypothetical protein